MLGFVFFIISLIIFTLIFDKLKNLQWKIDQLESRFQNPWASNSITEKTPLKPQSSPQTSAALLTDNKAKETPKDDFEKNFAEKIMIWIGSIAIIFSGFYMVKYSIENSLFTAEFRLILSFIFSIILFILSEYIYKSKIDNRLSISQGLTGAGIAILYACTYAACNIYAFIPTSISLVFLALITTFAIYSTNKYGLAIAIIGLIGGFLTPILFNNGQIEMFSLFAYFYFINISISYISKSKGYSGLGIGTTFLSIIISLYFLLMHPTTTISLYSIGIFLIAISYSNAYMFSNSLLKENRTYTVSNILACLTALFVMYYLIRKLEYNIISLSLFWISSLFSLVLLSINVILYRYLPFASLLLSCCTIIKYSQYESSTSICLILIGAFLSLYVIGSYVIEKLIKTSLIPRILSSASLIYFYLVFSSILNKHQVEYLIIIKALLAITVTVIESILVWLALIAKNAKDNFKNSLASINAFNAGIFCILAATAAINYDALIIILPAQITLIALLNYKYQINSLKSLALIIFIYLFFEYHFELFVLNIDLAWYLLTSIKKLHFHFANIKLIELGFSMALILFAGILLKKSKNFFAGISLEIFSLFSLITLLFIGINNNFTLLENASSLVARGITNNLLLALALLFVFCGKKFDGRNFLSFGLSLSMIAMFRIISQDLVFYFPLFNSQEVGELFIFNYLLISMGAPILWLHLINRFSTKDLSIIFKPMQLLLCFCLISLNIRQAYHGSILSAGITSNLEIYTYSIVWIIFGIILVVSGTILNDKYLRHASLAVLLISIGKVFLYDVSQLSGLYRVFSFLVLGICLIILGWFYSKYVFKIKQEN